MPRRSSCAIFPQGKASHSQHCYLLSCVRLPVLFQTIPLIHMQLYLGQSLLQHAAAIFRRYFRHRTKLPIPSLLIYQVTSSFWFRSKPELAPSQSHTVIKLCWVLSLVKSLLQLAADNFQCYFLHRPNFPLPTFLFVKLGRTFGFLSNQNSPPPNLTQLLSCPGCFPSSSLCSNLPHTTSNAIFSTGQTSHSQPFYLLSCVGLSVSLKPELSPQPHTVVKLHRVLSLLKTRIPFVETICIVQPAGTFQLKKFAPPLHCG